ncbi:MAG: hypothetical protein AAGA23_07790 [Pseudomonadota bacterium]
MIAIEIDPTVSLPERQLLPRNGAQKLSDSLSADLNNLIPGIQHLGLGLSAALYDQTQILSPGFVVHETLRELYAESQGSAFQPLRMALGAHEGSLPREELAPVTERLTGPLLIIPWVLTGPEELIAQAATELEKTLVEQGQVSPQTALVLNELFGMTAVHAQYLTLNDLAAMLSLQFTNVGLPELWELLDAALFDADSARFTQTDCGSRVAYLNGRVDVLFQPFDAWSATADPNLEPSELAARYAACLRSQRQITVTLAAHGVAVRVIPRLELPDSLEQWAAQRSEVPEEQALTWHHIAIDGPAEGPMQITQHADPDLGSVAFSVGWEDSQGKLTRLEHHYPLVPQGVVALMNRMQDLGEGERAFSYPGCIVVDPETRGLTVDPDASAASWH